MLLLLYLLLNALHNKNKSIQKVNHKQSIPYGMQNGLQSNSTCNDCIMQSDIVFFSFTLLFKHSFYEHVCVSIKQKKKQHVEMAYLNIYEHTHTYTHKFIQKILSKLNINGNKSTEPNYQRVNLFLIIFSFSCEFFVDFCLWPKSLQWHFFFFWLFKM